MARERYSTKNGNCLWKEFLKLFFFFVFLVREISLATKLTIITCATNGGERHRKNFYFGDTSFDEHKLIKPYPIYVLSA